MNKCDEVTQLLNQRPDRLVFTRLANGSVYLAGVDANFSLDEVRRMLSERLKYSNSEAVIDELQMQKTSAIQVTSSMLPPMTKQSNTAVVVDMYEVDYVPPTLGESTQTIEKQLNPINDFITRYTFPDTGISDVIVGPREKVLKKKKVTQKDKGLPPAAQPKMAFTPQSMKLEYHINLNERGSFFADVRNAANGKTVFEIRAGNELPEGESSIFEDGYMVNAHDVRGLLAYLQELGIASPHATLRDMQPGERVGSKSGWQSLMALAASTPREVAIELNAIGGDIARALQKQVPNWLQATLELWAQHIRQAEMSLRNVANDEQYDAREAFAAGQETVWEDLEQTSKTHKYDSFEDWLKTRE